MTTKPIRINATDVDRLEIIRKGMVMQDGQNRTTADAVAAVLDRYDMTAESILELSKAMVLAALNQAVALQQQQEQAALTVAQPTEKRVCTG